MSQRTQLPANALVRALLVLTSAVFLGCSTEGHTAEVPGTTHTLEVTASAYNSVASQTNANPTLAAWGDRLEPGMKAIAVSRDLIGLGLTHKTEVEIEGFEGVYIVRDKMAKRWKKKIDIYMGEDVAAARRFGKQTVTIRWTTPGKPAAG